MATIFLKCTEYSESSTKTLVKYELDRQSKLDKLSNSNKKYAQHQIISINKKLPTRKNELCQIIKSKKISIYGWAKDTISRKKPKSILIEIDGYELSAVENKNFKKQNDMTFQWHLKVNLNRFENGTYPINVIVIDSTDKRYLVDYGKEVCLELKSAY